MLAPADDADGIAGFLRATRELRGAPFAEARLETLARLSAGLLADPVLRQDPASVSVAYWLRRAQLARLAEEFTRRAATETDVLRVPVGRVLHLAPSNVDTLFIYSWALAYLCGNASIVRLSQDRGVVVEALLGVIRAVAADDAELRRVQPVRDLRARRRGDRGALRLVRAPGHLGRRRGRGRDPPAAASAARQRAGVREQVFVRRDRRGALPRRRTDDERARVASGFFNDLFWFDQMACSSPHVVFWVGPADVAEASARAFEVALQAEVGRRRFDPPVSSAVHRRTYAFGLAASADVRVVLEHRGFVGVHVRDRAALDKEICGGGLFRHVPVATLAEVLPFVDEGDQTVTHWGFEAGALREFAAGAGARGLDRVVPIGEALAFDVVWDGFHLIDDVLRRVRVRGA